MRGLLFFLLCFIIYIPASQACGHAGVPRKTYSVPHDLLSATSFEESSLRKKAIVVGAGLAGLMDALVLNQEGFEVLVLEKRSTDFSRLNRVNLKVESESELRKLGIFEDFLTHVASPLIEHRYYSQQVSQKDSQQISQRASKTQIDLPQLFHVEKVGDLTLKEPLSFDPENSDLFFSHDGRYTVTIAEFQQFLSLKALERGVSVVGNISKIELLGEDVKSMKAEQGTVSRVFTPDLIVLADGSDRSDKTLGSLPSHIESAHPCHQEKWIFENVKYTGTRAFVTVLLKLSQGKEPIQISNVIFDPVHQRANIAVTVNQDHPSQSEIREQLLETAREAFRINKISEPLILEGGDDHRTVVNVINRFADSFTLGSNVVIAGDRAGVSSPLAGLGATLATTSYPYGIRKIAQAIHSGSDVERQKAFSFYNSQTRSYIQKWLKSSESTKLRILSMDQRSL